MVVTWLAWCSVPGNTRLEDQLRLERLSSVTVSRVSKLCSFRTARSSRLPGPSRSLLHRHDISSNLFAMVSVWLRRCAWRCQTSNNLMYLFLSWFSLDVNANGVRATASGGVPAKASSRSPKATCCAIPLAFTACSACLVASWNAPFRNVLASPNAHTSRPPIVCALALLNMHHTLIDRINLFGCSLYKNRSTSQQPDCRTSSQPHSTG